MDKTLIDETHRSLDEELSDLLPEVGESVVEDGEAPGLPEVGIEVLDETLVEARHQVVEETLVEIVEAQQVADINQLWCQAQYQKNFVKLSIKFYRSHKCRIKDAFRTFRTKSALENMCTLKLMWRTVFYR